MKINRIFAGAGLLILPFIFSADGGESIREPKVRFLAILLGCSIGVQLYRRVHPSLGCATIVFFLSAWLTAFISPVFELMALLAAFGSCLWVAAPIKNDIQIGLKVLEWSGLAVAAYALLLQLPGIDPILSHAANSRPEAFFGQHTLYGPFAVACFAAALFAGHYWRAFWLFLPTIFINSSFTFLSLGVVLAFFAVFRFGFKWAILGALMATTLGGIGAFLKPDFAKEALNDQSRFILWGQTYKLAKRHSYLGHGFSSFRVIYPIFQDAGLRKANGIEDGKQSEEMKAFFAESDHIRRMSGIFLHPHSEPLLVFFEYGLLGVLIALWWVAAFVWRWIWLPDDSWAWALAAIFFSFLANSLGNFPFHLIPQALLPLWAFVAVTSYRESDTLEEYAADCFRRR